MCGQEQAPGRKQLWQLRWRRAHPGEREGTGACGRAMVLPVEAGPWRGCEESIFGDPQGRVRSGLRYICGTGCKIKGVPLRFRAPSPSSPHGKSPALPSSGPEIACRGVPCQGWFSSTFPPSASAVCVPCAAALGLAPCPGLHLEPEQSAPAPGDCQSHMATSERTCKQTG